MVEDCPSDTNVTLYESLGASASKAGLHRALDAAGIAEQSGLFARVSTDLASNGDYHSFLHCDGAGTKSIVAYLLFRETGDVSPFASLAQDATVMNLDDVLCIGRPQSLLLANMIARNAKLVPDEAVGAVIKRYSELVDEFRTFGLPIELSGGETADCGDVVRTMLVDAVLTGRICAADLVNANRIVPGDLIVGLSSVGPAVYDTAYSSGIGSNGLTLARRVLLHHSYGNRFPEVLDESSKACGYSGPFRLSDPVPGSPLNIGESLLSPTRTYAPILLPLLARLGQSIHGLIHVTGGGLSKVLRFGRGNRYIKDRLFETPPLFSLIQQHGSVSWREMYQVFNMGHRLEVYLPEQHVATVINEAGRFGVEARVIGRVEASSSQANEVLVRSEAGEFSYHL